MKNNIIIAGVPRVGKSTISRKISKEFGYQHVSMDSINAGFERVFAQFIDFLQEKHTKFMARKY